MGKREEIKRRKKHGNKDKKKTSEDVNKSIKGTEIGNK
jgi:hypothetical protein